MSDDTAAFSDIPSSPYDAEELLRWAETYGHPEEWAKRAQAVHARAERLQRDRNELWARAQFPDPRPDIRAIFILGDACERFKAENKRLREALRRITEDQCPHQLPDMPLVPMCSECATEVREALG